MIPVGQLIPTQHNLSATVRIETVEGVRYDVRLCKDCGQSFLTSKKSGMVYTKPPFIDHKIKFCVEDNIEEYDIYRSNFESRLFQLQPSYLDLIGLDSFVGQWFISEPLPMKLWLDNVTDVTFFKVNRIGYTVNKKYVL